MHYSFLANVSQKGVKLYLLWTILAADLCTFDALVSINDTRVVCGIEGTCHPCNNVAYLFLDQWSKDNLLVLA